MDHDDAAGREIPKAVVHIADHLLAVVEPIDEDDVEGVLRRARVEPLEVGVGWQVDRRRRPRVGIDARAVLDVDAAEGVPRLHPDLQVVPCADLGCDPVDQVPTYHLGLRCEHD